MSTRTMILSIPSIEPIRDKVASQDEALAEKLLKKCQACLAEEYEEPDKSDQEEIDDQLDEYQQYLDSMILASVPPKEEPGAWNYLITDMIEALGLESHYDYPINEDYKHFHVWDPYRELLEGKVSSHADQLLVYLDEGRPLKGEMIGPDGCVFGWLTVEEVKQLHTELAPIDGEALEEEDLREFHDQLLETLEKIIGRGHELFLKAH